MPVANLLLHSFKYACTHDESPFAVYVFFQRNADFNGAFKWKMPNKYSSFIIHV